MADAPDTAPSLGFARSSYAMRTIVHVPTTATRGPVFTYGRAKLYRGDCFEWLRRRRPESVHGVVTDPPYGLVEYTAVSPVRRSPAPSRLQSRRRAHPADGISASTGPKPPE
jgi:hypothetical protein